jgi:hypothetical protein
MTRTLCFAIVTATALATGAAGAQVIKLASSIPAAASHTIPPKVKQECGVQTDLAAAIARNSDKIQLVEGQPKSGLRLEVTITEVHAPPGGMFSGPKWVTAEGNLKQGSKTLRSFRARRNSSGPFSGTCQTLDKVTSVMGEDIGGWLTNENAGSLLGEAR